jgi:glycosyltransferase involved in cell wall biosynthesis
MSDNPLVSILMPAYNAEKYIGTAIEGILNQTFTDFELIIVNDGSKDCTKDVILSYKDERIKYYEQENQGVARTLNNGLKFCRGKYIRRHDADDLSTPNSLNEQVEFMEKHPEVGLVSSRQVYMTENGKKCKKYGLPNDAFFEGKPYKYVGLENFTYKSSSPIVHGASMFDKTLAKKLGNYRPEFLTSEDNDLWTRILEQKKIVVLNSQTYYQRIHGSSATKKHGSSLKFYREKVRDFALKRQETGTDPLMRGESMPKPPVENIEEKQKNDELLRTQKKLFRNDILDYQYLIFVDAKDWKLVRQSIKIGLRDGWKLKQTWRAILFPLLGEKIVNLGVKIKSIFK